MAAADVIVPISEISAYLQRWCVRARVTSKSGIRNFNKGASGGGKVFHVNLLDAYGGEIRASFWNDSVDECFKTLQLGKCYKISRGGVKIADQRFNACNHRYELVFDKAAQIEPVDDDENIETVKLVPVDLRAVQARTPPFNVDLCGVVVEAKPSFSFTSKDGKELVKREVTVADDTASTMVVTLWGERAKQEDKLFEGNPVIGLKGVTVKEWNGGRSGSLSESGSLVFSPRLSDAERLARWWAEGGKSQSLTALSVTMGGGVGAARLAGAKSMDLSEMRKRSEMILGEPELYSVVCRLGFVQTQKRGEVQPLYYLACQEPKEGGKGLPCNRRLDSGGFCNSCGKAGRAAVRFNLRCRFADVGDAAWLTTFHEAAQAVVGIQAEQAQAMESGEGGREALEAAISAQYFKQPMRLTLRAKLDSYNGETKTNISCIDARPISRGERGRALLEDIRERLATGACQEGF